MSAPELARPSDPAAREVWVDAAKGACIALVVLWHVGTKSYDRLPWLPEAAGDAWRWANLVLQPVRVPLFFALSGYLAARAVHRPWGVLLRRRVLRDYWCHVVWLVLGSAFFAVGPDLVTRTARDGGELLLGLVLGYTNTWYLYALAGYLVLAKAALRLPLWLALGAGGVLAVVADAPVTPDLGNVPSLLSNLVFFLAGALRPDLVRTLRDRTDGRLLLGTALAYLPLVAVAVAAEVSRRAVTSTLLSVLGTLLGVVLAVRLAALAPRTVAAVAALGRRTLPVYVLHLPLLALLHAAALRVAAPPALLAALYPALAVALLLAGSLALHRLLLAARLGLLFRPPARLTAPGSLAIMRTATSRTRL